MRDMKEDQRECEIYYQWHRKLSVFWQLLSYQKSPLSRFIFILLCLLNSIEQLVSTHENLYSSSVWNSKDIPQRIKVDEQIKKIRRIFFVEQQRTTQSCQSRFEFNTQCVTILLYRYIDDDSDSTEKKWISSPRKKKLIFISILHCCFRIHSFARLNLRHVIVCVWKKL